MVTISNKIILTNLFLKDYFIGNHGPNDSKEKELYDNAVKCFKGAGRARSLANSQYVSNTFF